MTDLLDSWVSGNYWGQVAINHIRERVNVTHVVLSIPAIVIAVILVGIPFCPALAFLLPLPRQFGQTFLDILPTAFATKIECHS